MLQIVKVIMKKKISLVSGISKQIAQTHIRYANLRVQVMTQSRFNSSFSLFLIFTTFRVLICSSALSNPALLNKFWRILKNVSDDASAKLYVT